MFKNIFKLFLLTTLSFLLAACGGNSPEKTAKEFMAAAYTGNTDKVLSLVFVHENDKKAGLEAAIKGKFPPMVQQVKAQADSFGGVKSISVGSASYSADKSTATVQTKVTFKNSQTVEESVKLVRDTDKKWKVSIY